MNRSSQGFGNDNIYSCHEAKYRPHIESSSSHINLKNVVGKSCMESSNTSYFPQVAKQRALIKWLLCKAFDNRVPAEFLPPFYKDDQKKECVKPAVIHRLANGELYRMALSVMYVADPSSYFNLTFHSIILLLARKGFVLHATTHEKTNGGVSDEDDASNSGGGNRDLGSPTKLLTETTLMQTTPLNMASHLMVIEALVSLYLKECCPVMSIKSVIERMQNSDLLDYEKVVEDGLFTNKNKLNHFPSDNAYDCAMSALFSWISVCSKVAFKKPIEVRQIRDLKSGLGLASVLAVYYPSRFPLQRVIRNEQGEVTTDEGCISNHQLVLQFYHTFLVVGVQDNYHQSGERGGSAKRLSSPPFTDPPSTAASNGLLRDIQMFISIQDLYYSHPSLDSVILAFILQMFITCEMIIPSLSSSSTTRLSVDPLPGSVNSKVVNIPEIDLSVSVVQKKNDSNETVTGHDETVNRVLTNGEGGGEGASYVATSTTNNNGCAPGKSIWPAGLSTNGGSANSVLHKSHFTSDSSSSLSSPLSNGYDYSRGVKMVITNDHHNHYQDTHNVACSSSNQNSLESSTSTDSSFSENKSAAFATKMKNSSSDLSFNNYSMTEENEKANPNGLPSVRTLKNFADLRMERGRDLFHQSSIPDKLYLPTTTPTFAPPPSTGMSNNTNTATINHSSSSINHGGHGPLSNGYSNDLSLDTLNLNEHDDPAISNQLNHVRLKLEERRRRIEEERKKMDNLMRRSNHVEYGNPIHPHENNSRINFNPNQTAYIQYDSNHQQQQQSSANEQCFHNNDGSNMTMMMDSIEHVQSSSVLSHHHVSPSQNLNTQSPVTGTSNGRSSGGRVSTPRRTWNLQPPQPGTTYFAGQQDSSPVPVQTTFHTFYPTNVVVSPSLHHDVMYSPSSPHSAKQNACNQMPMYSSNNHQPFLLHQMPNNTIVGSPPSNTQHMIAPPPSGYDDYTRQQPENGGVIYGSMNYNSLESAVNGGMAVTKSPVTPSSSSNHPSLSYIRSSSGNVMSPSGGDASPLTSLSRVYSKHSHDESSDGDGVRSSSRVSGSGLVNPNKSNTAAESDDRVPSALSVQPFKHSASSSSRHNRQSSRHSSISSSGGNGGPPSLTLHSSPFTSLETAQALANIKTEKIAEGRDASKGFIISFNDDPDVSSDLSTTAKSAAQKMRRARMHPKGRHGDAAVSPTTTSSSVQSPSSISCKNKSQQNSKRQISPLFSPKQQELPKSGSEHNVVNTSFNDDDVNDDDMRNGKKHLDSDLEVQHQQQEEEEIIDFNDNLTSLSPRVHNTYTVDNNNKHIMNRQHRNFRRKENDSAQHDPPRQQKGEESIESSSPSGGVASINPTQSSSQFRSRILLNQDSHPDTLICSSNSFGVESRGVESDDDNTDNDIEDYVEDEEGGGLRLSRQQEGFPSRAQLITCISDTVDIVDDVGGEGEDKEEMKRKMEKRKEQIMLSSVRRRQNIEQNRIKKEEANRDKRDTELRDAEVKDRKREENKMKRQQILDQHRMKQNSSSNSMLNSSSRSQSTEHISQALNHSGRESTSETKRRSLYKLWPPPSSSSSAAGREDMNDSTSTAPPNSENKRTVVNTRPSGGSSRTSGALHHRSKMRPKTIHGATVDVSDEAAGSSFSSATATRRSSLISNSSARLSIPKNMGGLSRHQMMSSVESGLNKGGPSVLSTLNPSSYKRYCRSSSQQPPQTRIRLGNNSCSIGSTPTEGGGGGQRILSRTPNSRDSSLHTPRNGRRNDFRGSRESVNSGLTYCVRKGLSNTSLYEGPGSLASSYRRRYGPGLQHGGGEFDDGASDISSAFSSNFRPRLSSGPTRLFREPSVKSNRIIILNSIEHVVFAGVVNQVTRERVMDIIDRAADRGVAHFLLLFRDGKCQFRGLYAYYPLPTQATILEITQQGGVVQEEIIKLYGSGPKEIMPYMLEGFYKYNSSGKRFSKIATKHMTVTIDAFTIHNNLWLGKPLKSSQMSANNLPLLTP